MTRDLSLPSWKELDCEVLALYRKGRALIEAIQAMQKA
jgi:hypothetical protein